MDAGTKICSAKIKDEDGYKRKCGGERSYTSLLLHDMRRSAAKRLRESGIHEKLIMDIGGWKTRSMFDRYTITDPEAMRRAMARVVEEQPKPANPKEHMDTERELTASYATIQ
jgi:integrase